VLVVLLCGVISFILMTERSLISGVKNSGFRMLERTREDSQRRKEYAQQRREEQEEAYLSRREQRQEAERQRREEQEQTRARREEERRQRVLERENDRQLRKQEKETEKILRMDRKVSGVILDTAISRDNEERRRDDIHEIMWNEGEEYQAIDEAMQPENTSTEEISRKQTGSVFDFDNIRVRSVHQLTIDEVEEQEEEEEPEQFYSTLEIGQTGPANPLRSSSETVSPLQGGMEEAVCPPQSGGMRDMAAGQDIRIHREDIPESSAQRTRPVARLNEETESRNPAVPQKVVPPKKYMFPPISMLQKGMSGSKDSTQELRDTAMRLQQTLENFGVRVTITDISQGPSVTRYELQPEQGVKVSKIVGLTDDIKLNLAATDIRIEAPIPGKAAIGIEVPNKENMPVALRDLLESKEFKDFPSNLAFAVGKDIGGQTVVADIAKMPHMLIAGATGSGKSVCINTLIMSILYKAHPDDVKLIMVDPKVVELSVYNGIPHLLIPVVTDPKKASAALHWGVAEMTERYKKFADYNVRDLKGYNKKVESMREGGGDEAPAKMPQIVIIVDELADLMMVSPGEVEESICRLAQLARAAGI
ncbi:MAG: DNA translocase FtsK, partial [Acetatifactor sp.]|nr:DNA translocase FtsK [Acetatifactor sp.]